MKNLNYRGLKSVRATTLVVIEFQKLYMRLGLQDPKQKWDKY